MNTPEPNPRPNLDPEPNPEVLNKTLIDSLVAKHDIVSPSIEAAFRSILRHYFVPDQPVEDVYQDQAIATKKIDDTWISSSSAPTMMAIMLEQLQLGPGQRVLEIGAGTGFNAALMAHIVGDGGLVVTIDIDQDIIDDAKAQLATAGYERVEAICADGGHGWQPHAPYDRIILTVGAGDIAPAWWEQLAPGGILVLPLELGSGQMSVAFEKQGDRLESRSTRNCEFIRLRGAFADTWEPQRLGPDTEVEIVPGSAVTSAIDPSHILALLQSQNQSRETDVQVTAHEAVEGLGRWLVLRDPEVSIMTAGGEAAEKGIFPALLTFHPSGYIVTVALYSQGGLAVVYIPTSESPDAKSTNRFTVMVQHFGNDEELVERLVQLVQEWQQVGRPFSAEMVITAYQEERPPPDSQTLVIAKQWTHYHLQMPKR